MKVGRNDNGDIIVIFSTEIPVAFEINYFSIPIKESKKALKIFQEVIDSIDHLSSIMYELSEKSLSLLKR